MKTKSKNTTPILFACIGAALIVTIIAGIIFANNGKNEETMNAPVGDSRMVVYGVGSNKDFTNGNVKFLSLKNSVATLSFTNETTKEWEPELEIQGFQATGETAYYMDIVGRYGHTYTLTNKDRGYESDYLLYDELKYSIDGKKSDSCVIPPDGKEHIVEIDYSYLKENDIELASELYIDSYYFLLRFDDSFMSNYLSDIDIDNFNTVSQ